MMDCPRCRVGLRRTPGPEGLHFGCPMCGGRLVAAPVVRKATSIGAVGALFRRAAAAAATGADCPVCRKTMAEIEGPPPAADRLDVCTRCQFLWFDAGEWSEPPPRNPPPRDTPRGAREPDARPLPPEVEIELGRVAIRQARDRDALGEEREVYPALARLAGTSVRDSRPFAATPVSWFLIALLPLVFAKVSMHLGTLTENLSLDPDAPLRLQGLTFLTAPLLHESVGPLLLSVWLLLVFGRDAEEVLGGPRFGALLVLGALVGGAMHVLVGGATPLLGAAHVGAALATFFAVRFPDARVPWLVWGRGGPWLRVHVWAALGIWITGQLTLASTIGSPLPLVAMLGAALVGLAYGLLARRDAAPA